MAFSDRLKIARERKNYNQKDLSMKIGRSQNVINGYESGRSKPNLDDFVKLLNLLEVDANFLLYDELSENVKSKIKSQSVDVFDGLNVEGRQKVISYADDLKLSGKYDQDETIVSQKKVG